jgi:hypothetical protein
VFLSLSPCAENTEEEDVKCKARCREKDTKGFRTKPEIWVVTFATGEEENERLDIDLLFTSAQLLQHTSELVVSAQLMFFQWRWRDQLPCCSSSCSCCCSSSSMDCTTREEAHRKKIYPATEENLF